MRRSYVVGQPTATNTVVKSAFPNDYALAIADSASQASTSQMLYVQIPSAFRSQWGLAAERLLSALTRGFAADGGLVLRFRSPF